MSYSEEDIDMNIIHVDKDFFNVMGIQIELGQEFTRVYSPEYTEYLVNEAGMELLGEDANSILNRNIRMKHGGVTLGPVVGVVGNFNFASLHNDIGPLVISQNPGWYELLLFRINPTDLNSTISIMKSRWEKIVPELPFEYSFLDQDFDRIYRTEQKLSKVFIIFTTLAIFIACFGLFGLSSFETIQRTKEIGIRRVLGATAIQVVSLFIKENIKLIIIALFLAIPFAYYLMNYWLQGFAFRIEIGAGILVFASIFVMMVTIITVAYHAIRTSIKDPSTTLRYE
jgi:putative ABC transport system permease protein